MRYLICGKITTYFAYMQIFCRKNDKSMVSENRTLILLLGNSKMKIFRQKMVLCIARF